MSVNHITPPFYNMVNEGLLDAPVFSLRIGTSEDDGGEAIFGGIDETAFKGKIDYVPVRRKAYWEVELEKISFGGDVLEFETTGAAIDTSTCLLRIPNDAHATRYIPPDSSYRHCGAAQFSNWCKEEPEWFLSA
jgi:saccharopepsin